MKAIKNMDPSMRDCIETCNGCADECEAVLFQHCLQMGGEHVEEGHVRLMADCIEACRTSARFMLRASENHVLYCGACAEVCEACADSCDEVGGGEMEACADTCRRCADSCRAMSGYTGRGASARPVGSG